MSKDEDQTNDNNTATVLVHLENSAEKIGNALQEYYDNKIPHDELNERINAASPKLEDVGVHVDATSETSTVNNKPVPENPRGVVYFYTADDGTLKATVRLPHYGDNATIDGNAEADVAELAALEVVRSINIEHQQIIECIVLGMAMEQWQAAQSEEGVVSGDDSDPLSSIEDEDTREQVRKAMTRH